MTNEITYQLPNYLLDIILDSIKEIRIKDKNEITAKDNLINENIKVNLGYHLNDEGDTIIHLLSQYDKVDALNEIIKFFKENNLDYSGLININDNDNYTPLHLAASNGSFQTVEFLCKHKANVNSLSENLFTPLHVASGNGSIEIVDYLIKYGANTKAITGYGSTVLHYAAGATGDSHFELVKYLMEKHGAIEFINYQDEEKYTPLHEATHSGNLELTKYLIEECGADPTLLTAYGNSVLHMAAVSGNFDLVKYLVEKHKANVNAIDNNKHTILHYAVMGNNLKVVKYLIEEHGLDANATFTDEFKGDNVTTLELVSKNNVEMIDYLKQKIN